ncbi:MAG: hypothetical protein LBQ83_01290 [Candidatus Margulisbacteria bacterium]|jgi:hypothetical protein|nr:hypothetical protein [Candidatus Margulisiibacteriota bacterium]
MFSSHPFLRLMLDTVLLRAAQCSAYLAHRDLLNMSLRIFLVYLSFIVLGFFFLFFCKRNLLNISEYLRLNYRSAVLSGAAGLILTPVLFLALLFTLLGSFLLLAFIFMYCFFLLLAFYSAALLLGEFIMRFFTFRSHLYVELLLGTTVLFFSVFVPLIGGIFFFLLLLLGMGGVLNLRFGAAD